MLRKYAVPALQLLLFGGLAALVLIHGASVTLLRDELAGWGAWGVAAFVLLQFGWMLTTVPSMPVMVLGGMIYGQWLGTLYALIGGVLAYAATFEIGLRLWRKHGSRRAAKLQPLVATASRHPIASIVIARLAPVFPLTMLSYGIGATGMSRRLYLAVSALVLLPGAALYTGIGSGLRRLARGGSIPLGDVIGLLALTAIAIGLTWFARKQAKAARDHSTPPSSH